MYTFSDRESCTRLVDHAYNHNPRPSHHPKSPHPKRQPSPHRQSLAQARHPHPLQAQRLATPRSRAARARQNSRSTKGTMPTDMTRYGAGWDAFSWSIRATRANFRCECTGQCRHHGNARCVEVHHTYARWARGRVRLTVAHLCTCNPPCQDPNHVIAACQKCHLRIDAPGKAARRRQERRSPALPYPGTPLQALYEQAKPFS